MTTPLIGGPVAATTAPTSFSLPEAYADAGYRRKQSPREQCTPPKNARSRACKPRANCLKPKEFPPRRDFDLPCGVNYLKVKRSPESAAAARRQDMHDA
jgi:hypothetical protein